MVTTKNHFSPVSIIHIQNFPLLYTWSLTNKWQFSLFVEHSGYYVLNHGMNFLQLSNFSFTCWLLCRPLHFHVGEFYCVSSMSQHLLDLITACTLSSTTVLYETTGRYRKEIYIFIVTSKEFVKHKI